MKNYSNHSSEFNIESVCLEGALKDQIFAFVIFEIFIVLISLLIVSSSSLVIYRIIKAQLEKVKYDFAFIILSVSDIGVGLFTVPRLGIQCYYSRISQNMPYIASIANRFFLFFPFSFSGLLTTVMAVDKLILIRFSPKYKKFFTTKLLKFIAMILFLISVTMSSISVILAHNVQSTRYFKIFFFSLTMVGGFCTALVILTHLYVLYFALRRPDLKILRKNSSKNYNGKRLTNTIICICISQFICAIPYFIYKTAAVKVRITDKLFSDIEASLAILLYSQCFWNALIILKNKKTRTNRQAKKKFDHSRMGTR